MGDSSAFATREPFGGAPYLWRIRLRKTVSASRFAALPVGAQSRHLTLLARRMIRIEFTSVVFPTPGPPVMITTRLARTVRRASRWLRAKRLPVLALRTTSQPFRSRWAGGLVPHRPWF